ncbi:hypothetical protein GGR54DRAFT_203786 [Hypoxylon sp. NC1633]|nr:hypothetical protein GGR54DRAFT_84910 [Hypoxylon sp. NC1633]KAI2617349.1 hypothetical protein GGR54DRAFT_203786 [Hypoxylon sp. NC1633]
MSRPSLRGNQSAARPGTFYYPPRLSWSSYLGILLCYSLSMSIQPFSWTRLNATGLTGGICLGDIVRIVLTCYAAVMKTLTRPTKFRKTLKSMMDWKMA